MPATEVGTAVSKYASLVLSDRAADWRDCNREFSEQVDKFE